jgi:hypothetical protein
VVAAVVGGVLGFFARRPVELWIAQILTLYAAVFFSGIAIYLFTVGSKAGWRSDGPGALFIMIVVALGGAAALVCWALFLKRLFRSRS